MVIIIAGCADARHGHREHQNRQSNERSGCQTHWFLDSG
jgi:hypothetical protein